MWMQKGRQQNDRILADGWKDPSRPTAATSTSNDPSTSAA